MPMSKAAKARRKALRACRSKTAKANVYGTLQRATAALRSMRAKHPDCAAVAFKCEACGRYHLGKPAE